jgi:hypothetical protein
MHLIATVSFIVGEEIRIFLIIITDDVVSNKEKISRIILVQAKKTYCWFYTITCSDTGTGSLLIMW